MGERSAGREGLQEAFLLTALNYVVVGVLAGAHYLAAARNQIAIAFPVWLYLVTALLAGALVARVDHMFLSRRPPGQSAELSYRDWGQVLFVFFAATAVVLEATQQGMAATLPEPRVGRSLVSLALSLLLLGVMPFEHVRSRHER